MQQELMRSAHANMHDTAGPAVGNKSFATAGLQQLQGSCGQNVTDGSRYTDKQTINNTKEANLNFPIQSLKGSAESSLGQRVAVKTTIADTNINTRDHNV